jgi:hypothetical protein
VHPSRLAVCLLIAGFQTDEYQTLLSTPLRCRLLQSSALLRQDRCLFGLGINSSGYLHKLNTQYSRSFLSRFPNEPMLARV